MGNSINSIRIRSGTDDQCGQKGNRSFPFVRLLRRLSGKNGKALPRMWDERQNRTEQRKKMEQKEARGWDMVRPDSGRAKFEWILILEWRRTKRKNEPNRTDQRIKPLLVLSRFDQQWTSSSIAPHVLTVGLTKTKVHALHTHTHTLQI